MFPNPHDALPLPSEPNLEQYKKRAKDLARLANSSDEGALRAWAVDWLDTLARLASLKSTDELQVGVERWIPAFEGFVQSQRSDGKLPLARAQFVLARAHGFESWPKFAKHVDAVGRANSSEAEFEAAADAVLAGDLGKLAQVLRRKPELVRARSTRQHRATLLHYVGANGVEGYRQKTPKNAVEMARLLLDSGSDVNAEANVYGAGATALELVATSVHPERAGVQRVLMALLLDRGATEKAALRTDRTVISACLANGQLGAAEFLAGRAFRIDLEGAAGLGRLDLVKNFLERAEPATEKQLSPGLCWACEYGRTDVVEFLLKRGVPHHEGVSGQTPLHWAVIGGHAEIVRLLLAHGADLEAKNAHGGTALGQALWSYVNADDSVEYVPVVELLIGAGAVVTENATAWIREQRVSAEKKQRILEVLTRHG